MRCANGGASEQCVYDSNKRDGIDFVFMASECENSISSKIRQKNNDDQKIQKTDRTISV